MNSLMLLVALSVGITAQESYDAGYQAVGDIVQSKVDAVAAVAAVVVQPRPQPEETEPMDLTPPMISPGVAQQARTRLIDRIRENRGRRKASRVSRRARWRRY